MGWTGHMVVWPSDETPSPAEAVEARLDRPETGDGRQDD